jgi:hypothetical protein
VVLRRVQTDDDIQTGHLKAGDLTIDYTVGAYSVARQKSA